MQVLIETERLLIRPLQPTDEQGMFDMDSDPVVHRYLGNKPVTEIRESREVIEFIRSQYMEFGIGRWAIEEKATNEFVGWTGFKWIKGPMNRHCNYYDYGYRLMRKFWRKGYGYESGYAALQFGLNNLKFRPVYAMTDVENVASRSLLEKLGFQFKEIFKYDAEPGWRHAGEPTTWYEWGRSEYMSQIGPA